MTRKYIGVIYKCVLGIAVVIKNEEDVCVNEAKRVGIMIDRGSEMQVRRGDTLILYISQYS